MHRLTLGLKAKNPRKTPGAHTYRNTRRNVDIHKHSEERELKTHNV